MALGALLPWAEADLLLLHVTTKGTDGDGTLTLVVAGVGAVLLALVKSRAGTGWTLAGAGALTSVVGVYNAMDLEHTARSLDIPLVPLHLRAGLGLWLTLLGAAVALVVGVQLLIPARQETAT